MNDEQEQVEEGAFFFGVIKLVTGDMLLSTIKFREGGVLIDLHYPVRVYDIPMMTDDGGMVEKFLLQDYLPFSKQKIITVDYVNTLYISSLSPSYVKKYIDFIQTINVGERTTEEFSSYVSDLDDDEDEQLTPDQPMSEEEESEIFGATPTSPTKKWLH